MRAAVLSLLVALAGCSGTASGTVVNNRNDGGIDGGLVLADMAYDTTSCVGGGTDCTTGAPGACNDGIVTCTGKQAMCTMKSTVQSCYDGPANTAGVGACTQGTQSCNGPALGTCEGEILPAAKEDCTNDADDDCNGVVNNTCPSGTVTFTNSYNLTPEVGATAMVSNATNLRVLCPTNAFVSSVVIEFNDPSFQMAGIRLGCSSVALTETGSGVYTGTLTALTPSPYISLIAANEGGTGTPITLNCANATGLRGIWGTRATYDSGGVLGFFAQCGAATIAQNTDNTLAFTMAGTTGAATNGTPDSSGFVGYDYGASQGINHQTETWTCGTGEVVVGFNGNVSSNCASSSDGAQLSCLNNVQPICATITPSYL